MGAEAGPKYRTGEHMVSSASEHTWRIIGAGQKNGREIHGADFKAEVEMADRSDRHNWALLLAFLWFVFHAGQLVTDG